MGTAICHTTVWHGDGEKRRAFWVSTIDRESSAVLAPDHVYAETLAWEYDPVTDTRGKIIGQDSGMRGGIWAHQAMVERLHRTGSADKPEEE